MPPTARESPRGGRTRRYEYDARGNLTAVTEPDGFRTEYETDEYGHVSAIRDAAGGATGTGTKSVGLPVSLTAPDGVRVIFVRDAFGRITEATDALGGTLRQGWTVEGEPAWWELPDGTCEEWSWDGEGNLVSHTTVWTVPAHTLSLTGEADEIAAAFPYLLRPDARWTTERAYSYEFEASVDCENLARQPRRGGICEADEPGRYFLRVSPPSQRDPGCLLFLDRHHFLLREPADGQSLALGRTGGNGIDSDPVLGQLDRPGTRQLFQGGLGRPVVGTARVGAMAVGAGDVDDRALAAAQVRQRCLGEHGRGNDVEVEQVGDARACHLVERDTCSRASVVHHHVKLLPSVDRRTDDQLRGMLQANVSSESRDAWVHGGSLVQGHLASADTEDVRPRLGHRDRRCPADPGTGSGDDDDAVMKGASVLVFHQGVFHLLFDWRLWPLPGTRT